MDRRRQERYKLDLPVTICSLEGRRQSSRKAMSRDISSTGVFVKIAPNKFRQQQKVHLELTLRLAKGKELFGNSGIFKLVVDGSVIRSIDSGIVVEFEKEYSISPV